MILRAKQTLALDTRNLVRRHLRSKPARSSRPVHPIRVEHQRHPTSRSGACVTVSKNSAYTGGFTTTRSPGSVGTSAQRK
jgi:hypothetical protein